MIYQWRPQNIVKMVIVILTSPDICIGSNQSIFRSFKSDISFVPNLGHRIMNLSCNVQSTFVSNRENIKQLIAQKDIIQSNSMVEAVNKHIKYYYLFKKDLKDLNDTIRYLSNSVDDYNDNPHGKLYGLTPNEVLNGIIPVKDNYQQDMIKARKNRLKQNRLIECCENK